MKNFLRLFIPFCLIFFVSCHQENEQTEKYQAEVAEKLAEVNTRYYKAWKTKDLGTCLSFFDEEFINIFSYGITADVDQCREIFQSAFDKYSIEGVRYERTECIVHHNMAFTTGWFEQRLISNDKQDTISYKMRVMHVFKKQNDESWKWYRLIGQFKSPEES